MTERVLRWDSAMGLCNHLLGNTHSMERILRWYGELTIGGMVGTEITITRGSTLLYTEGTERVWSYSQIINLDLTE